MNIFRYKLTIIAIVLFAGALYMLQRDVSSDSFLTEDARIDITDGALVLRQQYMGFYLGDQKIGYSRFVLKEQAPRDEDDPDADQPVDYYLFQSESNHTIQAMGLPFQIETRSQGRVNKDLSLRSFRFQFNSSGQTIRLEGDVETDDSGQPVMHLKTYSEGDTTEKTVSLDGPIYSTEIIHLLAARDGLEAGARYVYPVYDPLVMASSDIAVNVEGQEEITLPDGERVEAWKLVQNYKGFEATSWVDEDGEIYQENSQVSGIPFTAVRESAEEAVNQEHRSAFTRPDAPDGVDNLDLIDASRILSDVRFRQPSMVTMMRARLIGDDLERIPFDGYFQFKEETNDDGSIVFRTQRVDYDRAVSRAADEEPPFSRNPRDEEVFLEHDSLIQSNSERIRNKALEIAAGAGNRWDASEKIATWLYRNIQKEFRVTIPSALEVLNSMKGDCNEHSTLFAAMARSIGIPTKIVAGLVYQDDGFYYHAWNEVMVNGEWLPIDATLNRIRMDAAHVKLAEGALDSQTDIANLIGKLDLEVIDYEE